MQAISRTMDPMLTSETIQRAPKVLLHDHLDGGLRPASIIDLAAEHGYQGLPTTDPDDLAAWIRRGADRKSLELYLETFAHTIGVMPAPSTARSFFATISSVSPNSSRRSEWPTITYCTFSFASICGDTSPVYAPLFSQ